MADIHKACRKVGVCGYRMADTYYCDTACPRNNKAYCCVECDQAAECPGRCTTDTRIRNTVITLWHGGYRLEETYDQIMGNKKWEHGPGLNLTTHYETAREHSKGNKSLYLVTVEKGTDISQVTIPFKDVERFVRSYTLRHKQTVLLDDIRRCMERMGYVNEVEAESLLNLIINHEAIKRQSRVKDLQQFLVDHGVDYSISTNCRGRSETYFIVMNPKRILKVKKVSASDVDLSQYELSDQFKAQGA